VSARNARRFMRRTVFAELRFWIGEVFRPQWPECCVCGETAILIGPAGSLNLYCGGCRKYALDDIECLGEEVVAELPLPMRWIPPGYPELEAAVEWCATVEDPAARPGLRRPAWQGRHGGT
jgi:hypothetical protein